MNEDEKTQKANDRLELSPIQVQVLDALGRYQSLQYPLADWYLGALYVLANKHNPDRHAQAAHSLRELVEKLPRVLQGIPIRSTSGIFVQKRKALSRLLADDKKRYPDGWDGNTIDSHLDKTLRKLDEYIELNQRPDRKAQIASAIEGLDPLASALGKDIREEKQAAIFRLWKILEGVAHHGGTSGEELEHSFASINLILVSLLLPITAQDQVEISQLLKLEAIDETALNRLLFLIKRKGANYAFFFQNAKNVELLEPLNLHGHFKSPPGLIEDSEGNAYYPTWWPIVYLENMLQLSPAEVVDIVKDIPTTENPRLLQTIAEMAASLTDPQLSLKLYPAVVRYFECPLRWGDYKTFKKLFELWFSGGEETKHAARQLAAKLLEFKPDPRAKEKRKRREEDPTDIFTSLEPTPILRSSEYASLHDEVVPLLLQDDPLGTTILLIDTLRNAIELKTTEGDYGSESGEDGSEYWCQRLSEKTKERDDNRETLLISLTSSCEALQKGYPDLIVQLHEHLEQQHWQVFKRIRQFLCAQKPDKRFLPWVKKMVVDHTNYSKWELQFDFQRMIRSNCEAFGNEFLSQNELKEVFEKILSGPSKEEFKEWTAEKFSETIWNERQQYFHRMQFRPFACVLFNGYKKYYDKINSDTKEDEIDDEDYSRTSNMQSGFVTNKSPLSKEELKLLDDDKLLSFINEWSEEGRDEKDGFISVNTGALADAFKEVFAETIANEDPRLEFWMQNREEIRRPIFVRAIVEGYNQLVTKGHLEKIALWLEFSEWVLCHPDEKVEEGMSMSDSSIDSPSWRSSRRAVGDFVGSCVSKKSKVPLQYRDSIAKLLSQLCTEYDYRLDRDKPVILNRNDQISEAINNTRSRALENLIDFGFWVRRLDESSEVHEVFQILEDRLSKESNHPLALSEHALLGMHYLRIWSLDKEWAIKNKPLLFPQSNDKTWLEAFDALLKFTQPFIPAFEYFRSDFEKALDNLEKIRSDKTHDEPFSDRIGQQLFTYYLWDLMPLKGEGSLLEIFYEKTKSDPERWSRLFDHIGHSLSRSYDLNEGILQRIKDFFEWRSQQANPKELNNFTFWLRSKCLDAVWRLNAYANTLEIAEMDDSNVMLELETLNELKDEHLLKVIECFKKITDRINPSGHFYLDSKSAKPILKTAIESEDTNIQKIAEIARDNLLTAGLPTYLDLNS